MVSVIIPTTIGALSQAAHKSRPRAVLPRFRGSAARRLLDGREPRGDRTLPEPPAHQANRLQRPQRRFGLRPMAPSSRSRKESTSGSPRATTTADPAFLERCVAELDADPACVLAHTLSRTVDSEGRPFGKVRHAGRPVRRMDGRRFVLRHLLRRNELYNASMAVFRSFGTACGRGIRRIPLRRRLVFLDARRIAGPRVHRLRTAQRLPPPRRGHDDAGRTDGRTLRGGVADPACHFFADADGGTGTLGARRQAALPAAQSPPAVRTERSLRTAVEPLVRNLPMRPVTQSVVPNLRGAARQHVF